MKTLAIIVNYNSASLTLAAVQSILDSESIGPVNVVVVDNSEDSDEAERLNQKLPPTVSLHVNLENVGFGPACNLAYDQFPAELVLLLNPDARLLPGCLLRLQETLMSSRRIAGVAPQVFWDDWRTFFLPPSYPPALLFFQSILGTWDPNAGINKLLSALWRSHSIKVWQAKKPVKVSNLSGGLVLLKRAAIQKAGGLFDPRFFLYYEDTDLSVRLRKAGYDLLVESRAEAIHHFDQCGRGSWEEKRAYMARSDRAFLEKYSKGWKSGAIKVMDHLKARDEGNMDQHVLIHFTSPFALEVPLRLREGWLFEWSPNPTFIPSAGQFGKGPTMDFPQECWSMLAPGHYYGRLGSPKRLGGYLQVVSWTVGK